MSDEYTRARRQYQRKRNIYAKVLKLEKKFLPKVIDGRKDEYKRVKIIPHKIRTDEDDE